MKQYTCKTCEAELYWDSKTNKLKCEYCDSTFDPHEFDEDVDVEQKAEKADIHDKADDDSFGIDLVKYKCTECGAELVTAAGTVATTCAYCGRAISMTSKMEGEFKPDVVIPFAITKEDAKNKFMSYCKQSWLTPKEFQNPEVLKKIKGIYAPYWLHSFIADASAEIDCENVESKKRGDDKIVLRHQYLVSLDANGTFEKVPTDALKHLSNNMMDALEPFNYERLENFHPGYMAGFYAEEYNETSDENFPRARERAKQVMTNKMLNEAGSYRYKTMRRYNDRILNYTPQYAMLPVWLLHTEYQGKEYIFAINGDTGKVTGKLPLSNKKLAWLIGGVFGASQLFMFLIRLLEVLL